MKTRKMWANRRYFESNGGFVAFTDARSAEAAPVPLLVTSLEDAPDFEPGDRVRSVMAECVVMSHPFMSDGSWWVPVKTILDAPGLSPMVRLASNLTKLPREKSVLLRVTFAGHPDPDGFVSNLKTCEGVRVERVEDDDER